MFNYMEKKKTNPQKRKKKGLIFTISSDETLIIYTP